MSKLEEQKKMLGVMNLILTEREEKNTKKRDQKFRNKKYVKKSDITEQDE